MCYFEWVSYIKWPFIVIVNLFKFELLIICMICIIFDQYTPYAIIGNSVLDSQLRVKKICTSILSAYNFNCEHMINYVNFFDHHSRILVHLLIPLYATWWRTIHRIGIVVV